MKKTVCLVLVCALLSCSAFAYAAERFSDVPAEHANRDAIETLAGKGIIQGYPDGEFKPNNNMTRAEVTTVLCRALGKESSANAMQGETEFTDVPASHWASGYINYGCENGFINGMGDGTFQPENNVTYEQVIKLVVSALGYSQSEADSRGAYPGGYISIANEIGLTDRLDVRVGYPANRAAVAQIIFNAFTADTIVDETPPEDVPNTEIPADPGNTPNTDKPIPSPGPAAQHIGNISIGDSVAAVENVRKPFLSLDSSSGGEWKFYNQYENFLMIYFSENGAEFIYTTDVSNPGSGEVYTDKNDGDRKYAVSVGVMPKNTASTTERIIFEMTNAFRAIHSIAPLAWNDSLANAARGHSLDMATRGFFSHTTPDGKDFGVRIDAAGYDWARCEENIYRGMGRGISAVSAMHGWINSAGHRSSLLTTLCNELGVGWIEAESGYAYGTQDFALAGR